MFHPANFRNPCIGAASAALRAASTFQRNREDKFVVSPEVNRPRYASWSSRHWTGQRRIRDRCDNDGGSNLRRRAIYPRSARRPSETSTIALAAISRGGRRYRAKLAQVALHQRVRGPSPIHSRRSPVASPIVPRAKNPVTRAGCAPANGAAGTSRKSCRAQAGRAYVSYLPKTFSNRC
jgi:hypothetical protein